MSVTVTAAIIPTYEPPIHREFRGYCNCHCYSGYDLRTIPGRSGEYAYGMLPKPLFERLREEILARQRARAGRVLGRD